MVKLWWSFYFSINLKYNGRVEELARITEVDLELKPPSDKPNNRKKLDVRETKQKEFKWKTDVGTAKCINY